MDVVIQISSDWREAVFNESASGASSIREKMSGSDIQLQWKMSMKYQVTYRLMQPQSLPATSSTVIDAHSHRELDTRLARIKTKWQAQGYTVQILRVIAGQSHQHHFIRASKS
jgi:hypothetical protein